MAGPDVLLTTLSQTDPIKVRFGIADTDQMRIGRAEAAGRLRAAGGRRLRQSR